MTSILDRLEAPLFRDISFYLSENLLKVAQERYPYIFETDEADLTFWHSKVSSELNWALPQGIPPEYTSFQRQYEKIREIKENQSDDAEYKFYYRGTLAYSLRSFFVVDLGRRTVPWLRFALASDPYYEEVLQDPLGRELLALFLFSQGTPRSFEILIDYSSDPDSLAEMLVTAYSREVDYDNFEYIPIMESLEYFLNLPSVARTLRSSEGPPLLAKTFSKIPWKFEDLEQVEFLLHEFPYEEIHELLLQSTKDIRLLSWLLERTPEEFLRKFLPSLLLTVAHNKRDRMEPQKDPELKLDRFDYIFESQEKLIEPQSLLGGPDPPIDLIKHILAKGKGRYLDYEALLKNLKVPVIYGRIFTLYMSRNYRGNIPKYLEEHLEDLRARWKRKEPINPLFILNLVPWLPELVAIEFLSGGDENSRLILATKIMLTGNIGGGPDRVQLYARKVVQVLSERRYGRPIAL